MLGGGEGGGGRQSMAVKCTATGNPRTVGMQADADQFPIRRRRCGMCVIKGGCRPTLRLPSNLPDTFKSWYFLVFCHFCRHENL